MKLSVVAGATSQSVNVFIRDSSSTTGAGLTGLAYNTSSLTAYYTHGGANATATSITLATLAAVSSAYSSGGFKEIDSTNMPGWYRFDIPNACLATSKGRSVAIHLKGATNMAPLPIEIELTAWDNQDAVRGGLTALPNVASGSAGGLIIQGTGTTGLDVTSGKVDVGKVNAVSTSSVTTINANIGTTQPTNFTGTGASAYVKVDGQSWNGTALSTTNPLPNAAAGASGGLLISGSNTGTTTFGALTVTGATTLTGAVSLGSTLGITGAVTLSSTLTTGAVTFSNLTINTVQFGAYFPTNFASMTVDGITGYVSADVRNWRGTGVSVPTVAGVPNVNVKTINDVATTSVTTVSAFLGSTGAALNGTTLNTLAGHDPGAQLGTSTLTQAQVTGGAYALNSASFSFNSALDLTTTQKASVNAEALDVLATDTYAEPGQGAPAATTTLKDKINYLYKWARNKFTQTSTTASYYADDGTTVDQKATVTDDGTTFTRGEIASGP